MRAQQPKLIRWLLVSLPCRWGYPSFVPFWVSGLRPKFLLPLSTHLIHVSAGSIHLEAKAQRLTRKTGKVTARIPVVPSLLLRTHPPSTRSPITPATSSATHTYKRANVSQQVIRASFSKQSCASSAPRKRLGTAEAGRAGIQS